MWQHGKAVEKMQDYHLLGLADRGEVVHAIPPRNELQVLLEALARRGRQVDRHRREPVGDRRGESHALVSCMSSMSARRFRCTRRSEIAAGVTPWTRAAWPTVSGRCCVSFCCASVDSPRTPR